MPKRFLLTKLLFFKIFLGFSLGIIISDQLPAWAWLVLPVLIFISYILIAKRFKISRSKIGEASFFLVIIFAGIGFHYWNWHLPQHKALAELSPYFQSETEFLMVIKEKPIAKSKSWKIDGTIIQARANDHTIQLSQKLILYIPKSIPIDSFKYGDVLGFRSRLQKPVKPNYDFEFDYANWLARKHIFATAYAPDIVHVPVRPSKMQQVVYLPKRIRDFYEDKIDQYVKDSNSHDIAKSILIGVRTDIDQELMNAYSDTGTIHILSVSGLHFAILIGMIGTFLGLIIPKKPKTLFLIKHAISFIYALVTGFSPPVFRSFLMFLLFDVQKFSRVSPSSLNVLFLSAWMILLFDTNLLFDIGFQLSYIAILGLIIWQTRATWLLTSKYWIINKIWEATTTLLIASAFTAPVVIYYFHQLPILGLFSNYIVIPLTTFIMGCGFALMICPWSKSLMVFFGALLSWLLEFQNAVIIWFSHLPLAVLDYLWLGFWELVILLVAFIGFNFFFTFRSKIELRFFLIACFIFLIFSTFLSRFQYHTSEWYIIPSSKNLAFAYREHKKLIVFADSLDERSRLFFIKSLQAKEHILNSDIQIVPVYSRLTNRRMKFSPNPKNQPQYLILSRENRIQWKTIIPSRDSFGLSPSLGRFYWKAALDSIQIHHKKIVSIHEKTPC
jgi:competence protein ComEC